MRSALSGGAQHHETPDGHHHRPADPLQHSRGGELAETAAERTQARMPP